MSKSINYYGRRTPLPGATTLKHRIIAVPEWAVEHCWLHGGKQKKLECQGCIANSEMDADFDGLVEALGDDF